MDHELHTSFHYSSSLSCPIIDSDFLGDGSMSNTTLRQNTLYVSETTRGFMDGSDLIKAQIANHPLYPTLLSSYIDCRKVGAPPEMASVLEEISKENQHLSIVRSTEIGTDPELDHFMKSYCDALQKYKEELRKPFDEATNFLSSIGSQLTHLCKETLPSSTTFSTDSGGGCASDEEMSCGEVVEASGDGDGDLKEMLMRKYSGYVSSLRKEMLKKRQKGKLPEEAIYTLMEWWNTHFRWPYPTEEDKNRLSVMTGLDQKQINNWFINQRKRHWRPSEDMRYALMEGVRMGGRGGGGGGVYFDAAENTRGGDDNVSTN